MFNIVLLSPQIPNNTGSIGRMCVNIGATLHIVKPIAFDIDEKAVRRAGLDYWHKVDLRVWESVEHFFGSNSIVQNAHFATTKCTKTYFEASYKVGDFLFFGSETKGIDETLLQRYKEQNITIPMSKEGRSLNLATSVGIVTYEALKQNYNHFKEQA